MESVYTLLDIQRAVPEIYPAMFDIRALLDSTSKMLDGKKAVDLGLFDKELLNQFAGTVVEDMLREYNII